MNMLYSKNIKNLQDSVEFGVSIATNAEKCPPSYANNSGER